MASTEVEMDSLQADASTRLQESPTSPPDVDIQALKFPSSFIISEPMASVRAYTAHQPARPQIDELLAGAQGGRTNISLREYNADGIGTINRDSSMHSLKDGPMEEVLSGQSGWFLGVFVRVSVSIFGVIMFLRMNWMVGQAGLGLSLLVVAISTFITITVAFSISALCTNGQLSGGGPYYLVSRSLGIEAGQVIGMVDFWGQTVSIALNNVGFAETMVFLYAPNYFTGTEGWDKVVIAVITTIVLVCVACFGVEWLNKLNAFFLSVILLGVFMFFVGTVSRSAGSINGFTGYNGVTFAANWDPNFTDSSFFEVCGVFFPAVTGVLQGAYVSGDLRNPGKAIPFGTIVGIGFTIAIYVFILLLCAFTGDASRLSDISGTSYMSAIAVAGPIVTAAIFCAAISTSLCLISGAPRVLVATLKDGLFPRATFLTTLSARGEPVRGYAFAGSIAIVVTILTRGDLNLIAPIVTNLFIVEYIVINYACFLASYSRAPSWRPVFRYYNKWLALAGVVSCAVFTFVVSWISALVVLALTFALYQWVRYKKPDFNFGDSTDATAFHFAVKTITALQTRLKDHVKNYRPSFMLVTNLSFHLPQMRGLLAQFYKAHGLFVQGEVIQDEICGRTVAHVATLPLSSVITSRTTAVHTYVINPSLREGISCMLQAHGLGRLTSNILAVEFPDRYTSSQANIVDTYVNTIRDAMQLRMGIIVVRHPFLRGLVDLSSQIQGFSTRSLHANATDSVDAKTTATYGSVNDTLGDLATIPEMESRRPSLPEVFANLHIATEAYDQPPAAAAAAAAAPTSSSPDIRTGPRVNVSSHAAPPSRKKKSHRRGKSTALAVRGFVDVHMLTDDGGLPLLLAYLLLQNTRWSKCRMRLFVPERAGHDYASTIDEITRLLRLLRIAAQAFVLPRADGFPVDVFEAYAPAIENASKEASLTLITMPVPHAGASATAFLQTLDVLSRGMSGPVLLVRGNQQNVLTQYI